MVPICDPTWSRTTSEIAPLEPAATQPVRSIERELQRNLVSRQLAVIQSANHLRRLAQRPSSFSRGTLCYT
jgi:hypothetical protein